MLALVALLSVLRSYSQEQQADTCADTTITRHIEPHEFHYLLDDPTSVYKERNQKAFLRDLCTEQEGEEQQKPNINISAIVPVQRAFGTINFSYNLQPGFQIDPEKRDFMKESGGSYHTSLSFKKHPALFVMLNGKNQGVLVSYIPGRLLTIANAAGRALGVSAKDLKYSLRFFDVSGRPLDLPKEGGCDATTGGTKQEKEMLEKAFFIVHLLLEKELFVWPGISLGFEWNIGGSTLHTLALQPKVILARNFTSDALCDTTISSATSAFSRSPEKHYSAGFENYRTSQTAHASKGVSKKFQLRAANIGRLPTSGYVESLQLLKYDPRNGDQPGQWYKSHHDFYHQYDVDPARIRQRVLQLYHGPNFRENATYKARYIEPNRFLTFFPYLSDVEEGGETVFPEATVFEKSGVPPVRFGMPECSQGLSISPVKGAAALFYAMSPDGSRDYSSRHGGCPPEKGVKHAANLFTWNQEVNEIYNIVF